ncbi:hypothetical protein Tco_0643777, partial [Tanacetum coccineum]
MYNRYHIAHSVDINMYNDTYLDSSVGASNVMTVAGLSPQPSRVHNRADDEPKMSADVARGHGGDGGGDDRPPPHQIPTGCGGCLGNRAGKQHTRQETRNLGLKAIMDKSGPVPIRFEFGNRETLMPLGEHGGSLGQLPWGPVGELPLLHPSGATCYRRRSTRLTCVLIWNLIAGHLSMRPSSSIYKGKKATLKEKHWIPDLDETYDLERIRKSRPSHISEVNWDAQIVFWNDPKNHARAAQNKQNRAKSKVMKSSATREYPSLIHTFFLTHTVNGVFLNPEDKVLYGLGSNTEMGVPYTEDEIMAIVRGGKQWGHIPGVGRFLPRQRMVIPPSPPCMHSSDVAKLKKREKVLTCQVNMFIKLFRSDDKFSHMLSQLESHPEIGGGSGSGGCGDDEQGYDEDDD